jgi:hypothetical protein
LSQLSFVNNIARGVETLGVENAPIIYALSKVRWESVEDRDEVLNWMVTDRG